MFIAIKGKRFDGHDFIDDVVKGAYAVIINEKYFKKLSEVEIPVITVKDTTIALGDVARLWRSKLNATVIGITGSAGKQQQKKFLQLCFLKSLRLIRPLQIIIITLVCL